MAVLWFAACGDVERAPRLERSGALGTLRDLVLFERADALGGPFFLDRFEATRADFAEFAATPAGAAVLGTLPSPSVATGEGVLPMAGIDLAQARAFARWRCCRLPRSDEWTFACTTGGRDAFPWGSVPSATRANTSDLGVFAPLPVGTFESGRSRDGPYDLIGNVAEWTETVPSSWFHYDRDVVPEVEVAARRAERMPALRPWCILDLVPTGLLVGVADGGAPREVLGADFASSMRDGPQLRSSIDRADTIGVRLCTTPRELALALCARRATFGAGERLQLERFLRRGNHAAVMRTALAEPGIDAAGRAWLEAFLP